MSNDSIKFTPLKFSQGRIAKSYDQTKTLRRYLTERGRTLLAHPITIDYSVSATLTPSMTVFAPVGSDARLPNWLLENRAPTEAPQFDSVVIRGNGVGALICAARLARSRSFSGRVSIAMPRPQTGRRLINGCTFRARSVDYISAALGTTTNRVLADLFGDHLAHAATTAQTVSIAKATQTNAGILSIHDPVTWMEGSPNRPFAYGLRNGHLVGMLASTVADLGVQFAAESAESFDACHAMAIGNRPIILNTSHLPLTGVPERPKPKRFVVASQIPFHRREDARLPAGHSCLAMRHREGQFDTGVYYPFYDPLTPEANYYGIFYRIVNPTDPGFDKAREISVMSEMSPAFGDALGLTPIDIEATRGEAMVPCVPWADVSTHQENYMDLFRTYSACAPIITGDGMTRSSLAGWLCAEAILAGEDPVQVTNQSLHRWRAANRAFAMGLTTFSRPLRAIVRHAPRLVLGRVAGEPDMWSSISGVNA